jgi:hypothetical protein
MKTSIVAGSLLAALSLVAPLQAQRVAADVVVRSGPVAGRVVIADGYSSYRRPVTYRRPAARVIVVERVDRRHHPNWHRQGYRQVTVYYWDGRFYDAYDRRAWPAAREIVVYERNGRYYREWDDNRARGDRYDRRDRYRDGD